MSDGMVFKVIDCYGHPITELLVPWEELWHLKRDLLVSVSYGQIIWW